MPRSNPVRSAALQAPMRSSTRPPAAHGRHHPASWCLGLLGLGVLSFAASFIDAARLQRLRLADSRVSQQLTLRLGLSDPALMTEARHLRHRSQTDLHAPFQDHPLAFDLFPGGSLVPPPPHALLDRTSALPD